MTAPDLGALPSDLRDFWTERHLCSLTTLRADGSPHVVAVGAVLDPDGGCLWVITDGGSAKVRHARASPRVAVHQVDGARWSTVEGTAEVLTDPDSVARAVEQYAVRYRQPRVNPRRAALRITPTRILASAGLREGLEGGA